MKLSDIMKKDEKIVSVVIHVGRLLVATPRTIYQARLEDVEADEMEFVYEDAVHIKKKGERK
jgi:hypothetical protein